MLQNQTVLPTAKQHTLKPRRDLFVGDCPKLLADECSADMCVLEVFLTTGLRKVLIPVFGWSEDL